MPLTTRTRVFDFEMEAAGRALLAAIPSGLDALQKMTDEEMAEQTNCPRSRLPALYQRAAAIAVSKKLPNAEPARAFFDARAEALAAKLVAEAVATVEARLNIRH